MKSCDEQTHYIKLGKKRFMNVSSPCIYSLTQLTLSLASTLCVNSSNRSDNDEEEIIV
jgi:hypothetical protein